MANPAAGRVVFSSESAEGVVREAQANWITFQIRVTPTKNYSDFLPFFLHLFPDIRRNVFEQQLEERGSFKVQFALCLDMVKYDVAREEYNPSSNVFLTHPKSIFQATDLKGAYSSLVAEISRNVESFTKDGSGWTIESVRYLDINISYLDTFTRRGYSLVPPKLPPFLEKKNSLLKILGSQEGDCFYSATLSAAYLKLHPNKKKEDLPHMPSKLSQWEKLWEESELTAPIYLSEETKMNVSLDRIYKFENENPDYRVMVISYDCDEKKFIPVRKPRNDGRYYRPLKELILLVLFYYNQHYFPVKDITWLCDDHARSRRHICPFCLQYYHLKERLDEHMEICSGSYTQGIEMPDPHSSMYFKQWHALQKLPWVFYADTEAVLQHQEGVYGKTRVLSKHIPCAAAYYLSVSEDMRKALDCDHLPEARTLLPEYPNNLYKVFIGEDCMEKFLLSLYDITERLEKLTRHYCAPINMTDEWCYRFKEHKENGVCYMCQKRFGEGMLKCVFDHDHISGEVRGLAHADCNAAASWKKRLFPVLFHNWKNYDSHALCKTAKFLARKVAINCIPQSSEKYLSLSLSWKVFEYVKGRPMGAPVQKRDLLNTLRFIDSFQFLHTSLDNLAQQLYEEGKGGGGLENAFPASFSCHGSGLEGDLFLKKGIFPYCYLDSFEKLREKSLPPPADFKSDMKYGDQGCSEEEYQHAQRVWAKTGCQTLGDYMAFYLKTDVLLLADIFSAFRKKSLNFFNLDPVYFYTQPNMAWQAALKKSGINLELITDYDMYTIFEDGCRGGLCGGTVHYRKAVPECEALVALDANSLYAWCMTQPLPYSNFTWFENEDGLLWDQTFPANDLSAWPDPFGEWGYLLEVDLDYPKHLHYLFEEYPPAPAKEAISEEDISDFMAGQRLRSCPVSATIRTEYKLLASLRKKKKYKVHYRTLRLYLEIGMVLEKIHRIVKFRQKAWLKDYIEGNIAQRKLAKSTFESDFYKLSNNSVFGKTQEQKRKRQNFQLTVDEERMKYLIARPNYQGSLIFSRELVGFHMGRQSVKLDQPVYCGFTILDLAKFLMYEFYYKCLKPSFDGPFDFIQLCYTDTDSLYLLLHSGDSISPLEKLARLRDKYIDGSNLPPDHPLYNTMNKGVMGKFKEEMAGKRIIEMIVLRPKMYAIRAEDNSEKKTAKGVKMDIVKNYLNFEKYYKIYEEERREAENVVLYGSMPNFRSHFHTVYTENVKKKFLSIYENKRYWASLNDSFPYGHVSTLAVKKGSKVKNSTTTTSHPRFRPPFRRRDMLRDRRKRNGDNDDDGKDINQQKITDYFVFEPLENFIHPSPIPRKRAKLTQTVIV